jgi:hypothetical protein
MHGRIASNTLVLLVRVERYYFCIFAVIFLENFASFAGLAGVNIAPDSNMVTHFDILDVFSDFNNYSCDFVSWNTGEV